MSDGARTGRRLEVALRAGRFVVTAETTPPDAADAAAVRERVAPLMGLVDAVNVTDGAGARAHMSALACAAILAREGIEPVMQVTVRDRNRIAIQADLIGAGALGVRNVLCLHGDDPATGDQPEARAVNDLDSTALITTARTLREGALPSGRPVRPPPPLFIGAADTPREPEAGWRPQRLAEKIAAGADFFQTQFCFDAGRLERYMAALGDHGLRGRAHYIVGLGPLPSAGSARWMRRHLFGVDIPDSIVARLEGAADPAAEGVRICVELIAAFREIDGVSGVHLMAPRGEAAVARVIAEAGLAVADRPVLAAEGR